MNYTPKTPDESVNYSKDHPVVEFVILVAGLAALIAAVFFAFDLLTRGLIEKMSPAMETRVMKKMEGLNVGSLFGERLTDKYLDEMVAALRKHKPDWNTPISPKLGCSVQVNALALPDGTLIVLKGLLDRVKSEQELMFVLGHELGHFFHRHQLKALSRGILFSLFLSFLKSGNADFSAPDTMATLLNLSFSRESETEADIFGLEIVQAHYGHVGGALDFFPRVEEIKGKSIDFTWAQTHPPSAERIENLRQYAGKKNWKEGKTTPLGAFSSCTTKASEAPAPAQSPSTMNPDKS